MIKWKKSFFLQCIANWICDYRPVLIFSTSGRRFPPDHIQESLNSLTPHERPPPSCHSFLALNSRTDQRPSMKLRQAWSESISVRNQNRRASFECALATQTLDMDNLDLIRLLARGKGKTRSLACRPWSGPTLRYRCLRRFRWPDWSCRIMLGQVSGTEPVPVDFQNGELRLPTGKPDWVIVPSSVGKSIWRNPVGIITGDQTQMKLRL